MTGWFVEDFTLPELKTLRARERLPDVRPESARFDGRFEVPAFQEVIDLAKRRGNQTGRPIGIYPETKHPTYHRSIGLPLEERLVEALKRNGYEGKAAPAIAQSFEVGNLKKLRGMTDVRLVLLIDAKDAVRDGRVEYGRPYDFVAAGDGRTYGDLLTPAGLKDLAAFVDGIGPSKRCIVPADEQGRLLAPTTLVRDAHAAGLFVHPYTFRKEPKFVAQEYGGDVLKEDRQFFDLGVDGVFSDQPDLAVQARKER